MTTDGARWHLRKRRSSTGRRGHHRSADLTGPAPSSHEGDRVGGGAFSASSLRAVPARGVGQQRPRCPPSGRPNPDAHAASMVFSIPRGAYAFDPSADRPQKDPQLSSERPAR
jgi:hypothetical protein